MENPYNIWRYRGNYVNWRVLVFVNVPLRNIYNNIDLSPRRLCILVFAGYNRVKKINVRDYPQWWQCFRKQCGPDRKMALLQCLAVVGSVINVNTSSPRIQLKKHMRQIHLYIRNYSASHLRRRWYMWVWDDFISHSFRNESFITHQEQSQKAKWGLKIRHNTFKYICL